MTASSRSWRLHVHAITDRKTPNRWIKVRGKFPKAPLSFRNAEIINRSGTWVISICVEMCERRKSGASDTSIRLDLIDQFAAVRMDAGARRTSVPDFSEVIRLGTRIDELKSERDKRFRKFSRQWRNWSRRIAALSAKTARVRKDILHCWTTTMVRRSASIVVTRPPVKDSTRSAKGTEKRPGAAVEINAKLNRHVLSQAPASAIQMLEYKSAEAGVRIAVIDDAIPSIAVGRDLSATKKRERTARRELRKAA